MAARPSLTEGDFERVRQLRLHRLTQLRDMPGAVADRAFVKLLYGVASVRAHAARQRAHAGRHDGRRRARLSPGGDAAVGRDADRGRRLRARRRRADCRRRRSRAGTATAGRAPSRARALPTPARLNVVPRPRAPQSELRIGHVAVPRDTPDYHALVAANMVLGGQFVSRINLNLREDKGFTYGARTVVRLPPACRARSRCRSACRRRRPAARSRSRSPRSPAIRGPRPVTPEELALGVAALTRGYRAELRDRRTGRARGRRRSRSTICPTTTSPRSSRPSSA